MSTEQQILLDLAPTDKLARVPAQLSKYIPLNSKTLFIFDGHTLDQQKTVEELGLMPNSTVQVVYSKIQQAPQPVDPSFRPLFRGGFERLLAADVPREDVLRQRLIFLARTGFLANDQLQIMYMNSELIPPPRGYTSPRPQNVRQLFIQILRGALGQLPDRFPLTLTPAQVEKLYPPQLDPEGQPTPAEALSPLSFCLMFLEAGVPDNLRATFDLIDFSFVDDKTPCPTIPLRAMALEVAWNSNNSNNQNLLDMGRGADLLGPHEPVVPVNRVMSSFQRLLTLVIGVLLGLIFIVLAIPFSFHESMALELRAGIMLGCIGNVIFAMFIGISGVI